MTKNVTQKSNSTGLSVARELSLGVLPAVPVWEQREPNSYKDLGADYTSKARSPINASRQQSKGVIVDRDAAGGWQEDLTYPALLSFAEAIMFAKFRSKGDVVATGVTAAGGYAVAAGGDYFKTGDIIVGVDFPDAANNGPRTLTADGGAAAVAAPGAVDGAGGGYISKVGHVFPAGDLSVVKVGLNFALTSAAGLLGGLGVIEGEYLYVGGDSLASRLNDAGGFCRVFSVSADGKTMVLDKMQFAALTDGAGKTVSVYVGRLVKNEADPDLQVMYTHHIERSLGKANTEDAGEQGEYVKGAVVNTWSMPLNTADKVTMDFSFVGTQYEAVTSEEGLKAGTRPPLNEGNAFTTSNDLVFSAINVVGNALPLYAYLTDCSLSVNNNVKPNKALSVLGAFDLNPGNFIVTANATAYFADVTAQEAIANNDDITVSFGLVRSNQGIIFDMPLCSLGDGKPKIATNEPITLSLDITAARSSLISATTDYTLSMVFFDYLPTAAHGA
jgi:hypothetical protein